MDSLKLVVLNGVFFGTAFLLPQTKMAIVWEHGIAVARFTYSKVCSVMQ